MDIQKLLKAGESETVEFKAAFGKGVIISLTAFANTRGGKVIVGVDDRGRPTGIDVGPETEQRYLNEIKVATYPQLIPHITPIAVKGKNLLVFEINEYPIKTPTIPPIKTPTKKVAPLTALEGKIINEIKQDSGITLGRIAGNLAISRYTVAEYIKKLKNKGVIRRHGSSRAGYWEVMSADDGQ